jgi:hypothetical protein
VDASTNLPIPDLQVIIYASPGHPGDNNVAYSGMFYTGKDGTVEFKAGDAKFYYVQLYNKVLGYAPSETNVFRINQVLSVAGKEYSYVVPISSYNLPTTNFQKVQDPDSANFGLNVKFQSDEIISNESRYDSQKSKFKKWSDSTAGDVDIFLLDQTNYNKFVSSSAFTAYFPYKKVNKADILLAIPSDNQEWYFVISNKTSLSNYQYIDGEISLVEGNIKGITGKIDDKDISGLADLNKTKADLSVSPNPTTDFIDVVSSTSTKTIEIYSSLGLLVQKVNLESFASNYPIKIDLKNLESGVYFIKTDGSNETKQFIILR